MTSDYEKEKDKIRANPRFYDEKGNLRKDLTLGQFHEWQLYFIEKEAGCKSFVCIHDSDNCGIYQMCHITRYQTYQRLYLTDNANKCGMFDKVWGGPKDIECHYLHDEKDWRGYVPKEACLECTGRQGIYGREITKEEYEKFVKADYKHINHFPEEKTGEKDSYWLEYHQGWCKEFNDFMISQGYIVIREWEKYQDNQAMKELAHSIPGGPLKAESEILKFQVEAPKMLDDFFKKLGLNLEDFLRKD